MIALSRVILRIAAAGALAAAVAFAQPAADTSANQAALRQTAEKKSAEWEALAKALDNKIQRMPPCDARVRQSIDEVRVASEARLAALSEVLRSAIVQASAETQRGKDALAGEEANLREAATERGDTEQERVAVNAELADLKDTAKRRDGFDEPLKKLGDIADRTEARADNANRQIEVRALFSVALRDLLAAEQKRQEALDREQAALAAETSAWEQYYAARIARADTECLVIGGGKPSGKKKP